MNDITVRSKPTFNIQLRISLNKHMHVTSNILWNTELSHNLWRTQYYHQLRSNKHITLYTVDRKQDCIAITEWYNKRYFILTSILKIYYLLNAMKTSTP